MFRASGLIQQTNRYTAALRKLLSIKGEADQVGFGVHLEDERPEHAFLKGETRWAQFNSVTSAAGTLAVIGVANPAQSGVLVVITDVFFYTAAAPVVVNLETFVGISAPGTGSSMFATDLRRGNQATTARALARADAAYAGHIVAQVSTLVAGEIIDIVSPSARVHEIVLPPGTEAVLAVNAVGVNTLAAVFVGYERSLESGELITG